MSAAAFMPVTETRKCTACGRVAQLDSVTTRTKEDGSVSYLFSSRLHFCDECEGEMAETTVAPPEVPSMTPELMAHALAAHYVRTQALAFEACGSFDRGRVVVTDHMHADHARAEKTPGAILTDLCGRGARLADQSLAVVESAWALFHFSRFPADQQVAIRQRAEAIYRFLSEFDKPKAKQGGAD